MADEVMENDFIFKAHVYRGNRAVEIRKFGMKPEEPFRILEEKLATILHAFGEAPYKLLYKDSNNDFITMTTAEEYHILKSQLSKRETNTEYRLFVLFEDEFALPVQDNLARNFMCHRCARQCPLLCSTCRNQNERVNEDVEENLRVNQRPNNATQLNITESGSKETPKVTNNILRQNDTPDMALLNEAAGTSSSSGRLFANGGGSFSQATNIMTEPKSATVFKFNTKPFDTLNNQSLFGNKERK